MHLSEWDEDYIVGKAKEKINNFQNIIPVTLLSFQCVVRFFQPMSHCLERFLSNFNIVVCIVIINSFFLQT